MLTYRQYLTARARNLRQEYPDSTAQERREVLLGAEAEWIASLHALDRDAIVPLEVGRSVVARLGHAHATRMLRHVANYPACLPANRKAAIKAWERGE